MAVRPMQSQPSGAAPLRACGSQKSGRAHDVPPVLPQRPDRALPRRSARPTEVARVQVGWGWCGQCSGRRLVRRLCGRVGHIRALCSADESQFQMAESRVPPVRSPADRAAVAGDKGASDRESPDAVARSCSSMWSADCGRAAPGMELRTGRAGRVAAGVAGACVDEVRRAGRRWTRARGGSGGR